MTHSMHCEGVGVFGAGIKEDFYVRHSQGKCIFSPDLHSLGADTL